MPHASLTPVFAGLRWGLHTLVAALVVLVVAQVPNAQDPLPAGALVACLAATYAAGLTAARRWPRAGARLWLLAIWLQWVALVALVPIAVYLAFPLFFLVLHLLRGWLGVAAVLVSAGATVVLIGVREGWSTGGVIGPLLGAGVSVLIGLGYASLAREAAAREELLRELLSTQGRLADAQHEQGVLAERARLARDLHDTLAQSLSSIQMLLHAAERSDADRPGVEHVRLARETAAASLADTRRIIRALTPAPLDERGLAAAVERLADTQWRTTGLSVIVRIADGGALAMHLQTALLRIIQAAMANVVQHAHAREAIIEIVINHEAVHLEVRDDGVGFDPTAAASRRPSGASDSFGLRATAERVEALGGRLVVDSAPGEGTVLTVDLQMPGRLA